MRPKIFVNGLPINMWPVGPKHLHLRDIAHIEEAEFTEINENENNDYEPTKEND